MKTVFFLILFLNLSLCTSLIAQKTSVIDSLQHALDHSVQDTTRVNLMNTMGVQYRKAGKFDQANSFFKEALELSNKSNYILGRIHTYSNLGVNEYFQLRYPEANNNYFISLKLSEEAGYKKEAANAYSNIGLVFLKMGNYNESIKNHTLALMLFKEINYERGIAGSYNNMALTYTKQGKYIDALENNLASLRILEKLNDSLGIVQSCNNIGMNYHELGIDAEAMKYYFRGLKIIDIIDDKRTKANIYLNIGNSFASQGDLQEALKYFNISLKNNEEINNKRGVISSVRNIAETYVRMGNYDDALSKYISAMDSFPKSMAKPDISYVLTTNGIIFDLQKDYANAIINYQAALKIQEEIEGIKEITSIYVLLGKAQIKDGDYNVARENLNQSLLLSKRIKNNQLLIDSYYYLYKLDSAENKLMQSLENYKLMNQYNDSLLNEKSSNQISLLKIQYETEKKDKEIELLNKDNEIKSLQVKQQQSELLASRYEVEKNQNQMLLLNTTNEVQQLMLVKTQRDLAHQHTEAKAKAAELELINRDKLIKEQQLEKQTLQRNGLIIGTVLLMLLGVILLRSIHLRKKLEKQEAITHERMRISADLHDDIGSGLSKISLLSELIKKDALSPEVKAEAKRISETSLELSENISEIIWALNSNNDYLENLVAYIRRYAGEYFENSTVSLKITVPENIPYSPISGEHRRNLFFVVKEALHNIIKHAQATKAELNFAVSNNQLSVIILDNGRGLPESELNRFGNGMKNMMNRMKNIKGKFSIQNHQGTKIILSIPI